MKTHHVSAVIALWVDIHSNRMVGIIRAKHPLSVEIIPKPMSGIGYGVKSFVVATVWTEEHVSADFHL